MAAALGPIMGAVSSLASSLFTKQPKSPQPTKPEPAPQISEARKTLNEKEKRRGALGHLGNRLVRNESRVATAAPAAGNAITGY